MIKRFLIILILIFNLSNFSFADDIRDFEIEGMSIGDSLLDYFSKEDLKNFDKDYYPKSKKYYQMTLIGDYNDFDNVTVKIKDNDKKYIIASLFGSKYFSDNFSKCAKEKDEMIKFVSSFLKNNNGHTYEYEYPNNNGTAFITDFDISGGAIRIWCVDWSKKAEVELNYTDNLSLSVTTNKILQWINEAL